MSRDTSYVWYFIDPKTDKRPLTDKVRECAQFYQQKMGETANLCLVSLDTTLDGVVVDGIELRQSKLVRKNNYMLATIHNPYPYEQVVDTLAPEPSP